MEEKKKEIKRKLLKKAALLLAKPAIICVIVVTVVLCILSAAKWYLNKHDTKEDPNDPKNAPAATRNFLNDSSIDEEGKITSGKSINEFWDDLIKNGNRITNYLNSAEELSKLVYAARALDYPDTRKNPDQPIDWDKIDLDSKEIQGIIKFKRALSNGKTASMTYVSPTEFQELINKYTSTGNEKAKQEALKHFTIEKTASDDSSTEGKVASLRGMVFLGDSILTRFHNYKEDELEKKEGAILFYKSGCSATYFLERQAPGSNFANGGKEKDGGYFDWNENFKNITNPTGFYLMLGQNFFDSSDRIDQMDELVKKIRNQYPFAPIYISSVLRYYIPDNAESTKSVKQRVTRMNEELKVYCKEHRNNKIYYSDILRGYDDRLESGELDEGDHDHPNAKGVQILLNNIRENIIATSTSGTPDDFSPETRRIIMEHINDFNEHTYKDFINKFPGGYDGYMKSLGGVFAKYGGKGKKIQINTTKDFQEAAEFVWGLFSIWGFDYWNGKTYWAWGQDEKLNGLYKSAYYTSHSYTGGGDSGPHNINDICSDTGHSMRTNCNTGVDSFLYTTNLENHNYAEHPNRGQRIDRKEDLRVGDLVHFFHNSNETGWGHVAIVGEINSTTGEVILYDTGNRFIRTGKYKIPLSLERGGAYENYEKWVGRRHYNINQTSNNTMQTSSSSSSVTGQMIVDEAEKYVGKLPYVWGGQSLTTGADCSGFAWAILKKLGLITWPRTNDAGFQDKGTKVDDISQAQPGDILRFNGHIAIYKGNGYMVEALNTRVGITNTRKVTDESRPVIAIRRFTNNPGSTSGTGITASTSEEIARIPRTYNNDVFNVDKDSNVDPMQNMPEPSHSNTGTYRAVQSACYDGKYVICAQNRNFGDVESSSKGGRIEWVDMQTGKFETSIEIGEEGGHMDGVAYDSDRNMVIKKSSSSQGNLLQIDNNTKNFASTKYTNMSEYCPDITYVPTIKQLVGLKDDKFIFMSYDSSKNEYVKQKEVQLDSFRMNTYVQSIGTDGQVIYIADSNPGFSSSLFRVWTYTLDGKKVEEHALGSGYISNEVEAVFSDNNGDLWLACPQSIQKVLNYKANPANVNPGGSGATQYPNTTYQVKVATWSENSDKVESNDPEVSSYDTGMSYNMTTTTIPYQAIVSKYKMPFNYLWTMLVYSNDKEYTFDLAQLVKNSKIEITIHDNLNKNTTIVTDTYTDYTKIHAEADVNIEYDEIHTSSIPITNPITKKPGTIDTTYSTTENMPGHGEADGHNSVSYKVVRTTINNTNTLDIALTLADAWCTKYEKKYTYNGEKTYDNNSSSSLDNIVHAPVTKNGELGGLEGEVDRNAISKVNGNNPRVTGRSGEVATFQTTRQNRNKNTYTKNTTSSYYSAPGKNVYGSGTSYISTPKTGSLNRSNYVDLPAPKSDGDASNPTQGFCLVGDGLMAYVIHHNGPDNCTLYLVDINTVEEYDHIENLNGHGNTIAYDPITGEIIFPEDDVMKLIKVNTSTRRFEGVRVLPLPQQGYSPSQIAYNAAHDLFIVKSHVYTRDAFYSKGKPIRDVYFNMLGDHLHAGSTSYGNQVYYFFAEGWGHTRNYFIVCNILTGKQEEIIRDNMDKEGEEASFSSDGTLYTFYGTYGTPFSKTDYNYFADNNIDKSNITPGMVANEIARYNTGGEYTDKSSFEKVFNAHYNARSSILSATGWLFEALEQNEDTSKMVDLTKYLLYKATGHDYGVTEFDFEAYDPEGFTQVNTGMYGNTPQEKVWFALRNAGFSEYAVAGAMGNIEAESGFRQDAIEGGSGAGFGLCQWSFGRRTNLEAYAKSKGKSPSDIETQIEFLIGELTPGGGADGYANYELGSSGDKWNNASTIEEATEIFCFSFERPNRSLAHLDRRIEAAKKYYNEFHGKTAPTGSIGGGDILKACEEVMQLWKARDVEYSLTGLDGDIDTCLNKSHYACCATYVSTVLYKAGLLRADQLNGYGFHSTYKEGLPVIFEKAGWKKVSMSEIQPGDVVNLVTYHVLIYAGGDLYWDETTAVHSNENSKRKYVAAGHVLSGFSTYKNKTQYEIQVWRAPGK